MTLYEVGLLTVSLCAAASVALAIALVISARSWVIALALKADDITPQAFLLERMAARPPSTGKFPPDMAWPLYARRQLHTDVGACVRQVVKDSQALADRWCDLFLRGRWGDIRLWWGCFPLPLLSIAALLMTALVITILTAAQIAFVYALTALLALLLSLATAVMRSVEYSWGRLRGAEASCPTCFYVSRRPAYRCTGCTVLHRDIRPGQLGVFFRRCRCGVLLPTMALRAAWRLNAVCQRCERPLLTPTAVARDVRIPIFGDVGAGKTRFLCASLDALLESVKEGGPAITFPDEDSHARGQWPCS